MIIDNIESLQEWIDGKREEVLDSCKPSFELEIYNEILDELEDLIEIS
jgi:hypothetical protein